MQLRKFILSPYQTNGYLLSEGKEAIFIDPGDNPEKVVNVIQEEGLELTHILITHMHIDHFYGAAKLAAETGAEIMGSSEDEFMVETEIHDAPRWGYPPLKEDFSFTPISPSEQTFLGQKCAIIPTPGHTPGSLTFHFIEEKRAFVGDLIFLRSIGRTDFTGGDLNSLLDSVTSHIFSMPDETILYSGHGFPTNVIDEKMHNPHFND